MFHKHGNLEKKTHTQRKREGYKKKKQQFYSVELIISCSQGDGNRDGGSI